MCRRLVLWIVLSSFLVLSIGGCAGIQKALGLKVDLDDKPVKKLELDVVGTSSLCPGMQAPLIVTAVLDNGEKLVSEGASDGKVTWDNYQISATGGKMAEEGVFALNADPRETAAHSHSGSRGRDGTDKQSSKSYAEPGGHGEPGGRGNGGGGTGKPPGNGGSGGTTFSGGQQGASGERGRSGTRSGRDGRAGPRPELMYQEVAELW